MNYIGGTVEGGCLIGGRPKNCLNALQMMGQLSIANDCRTSLTFEVFYVLQNTMIASILHSLNSATGKRNSIMHCFFYFYNWHYTFRFGLQQIRCPQAIYIYSLMYWLFFSSFLELTLCKIPPSLDASLPSRITIYKPLTVTADWHTSLLTKNV